MAPAHTGDFRMLGRWRTSVGPPAVRSAAGTRAAADQLVVVNWNTHVGAGDLRRLAADLRRTHGPDVPLVFLLQEAFRAGPEVPTALAPDATFASLIRPGGGRASRLEIEELAHALELHAYYIPSMRNGGPLTSNEDRGNAILSTLPLTELEALELPFESQRRVAAAATVNGVRPDGTPWQLRVVSAHLDNTLGPKRLWIAGGELGRTRQVRGLLSALATEQTLVLGADLNTWFGFADNAYREAARAFPQTVLSDRRATFRGLLRLDHLFFRLPAGWHGRFIRAEHDYDSDHYPLIGTIAVGR